MLGMLKLYNTITIDGVEFHLFYHDGKILNLDKNACIEYVNLYVGFERKMVLGIISNYYIDIDNLSNFDKFILYHEVGHYMNGDIQKPVEDEPVTLKSRLKLIKTILVGRDLKPELKADAYAASMIGRDVCVQALIKTLSIKGITKMEVYARIGTLNMKK